MQITLFADYGKVDNPVHRDVTTALERIRTGKSREMVERIRNEKDTDKAKALKLLLPCVLFSGTFSRRNSMGLIQHSGLICLDLDKFPDQQTLKAWMDTSWDGSLPSQRG